jgi:hypothetical protein
MYLFRVILLFIRVATLISTGLQLDYVGKLFIENERHYNSPSDIN